MRASALVGPALGGLLPVLCLACGGGGAARVKASDMEPARLAPTRTEGAVVTARVRVHADAAHRAQNPGHEAAVRRALAGASAVLEPTVGLRLELVEVRAWERQGEGNLDAALDELVRLDPGDDVDWVIGQVAALDQVAVELHQLGRAQALGRHLVVRALNDTAEVSLLEQALGGLEEGERQALYARRKRHKEEVVLLHAIGHALGAMHVTGEERLMHPIYEGSQRSFAPENAALMRVAATARAGADADPTAEWRAVLEHIRGSTAAVWNEDEKARLVADLEGRVAAAEEGTAGLPLGGAVRPDDRDRFRAAERLHAAGQPLDAWEELEPLLDYYPAEASVQRLGCRLAVAARRDPAAIAARCGRAAELAPEDPEPPLRLAQAHLAADDRAEAARRARQADALAAKLERGAGPVWTELVALYRELGAVSWTEAAARRAGGAAGAAGAAEAVRWAAMMRARYGLAPGGPVAPEHEAEFVAAVRDLLSMVYERRFAEAEKQAAAMRRRFGDAPGIDGALCDLEIRRRRYPAARARCARSLERYPDGAWAHYLTGLLDKRDKKPAEAARHLERAIELDPELKHAYQVAAELHREAGRADDEARVRAAYQKQFGRPLP